jgi:nucleoside-diphosphate-sugar epimerase
MTTLGVFGGRGFVGSRFCKTTSCNALINARADLDAHSKDLIYFISTVHNYNVFDNPFLDIETNLTLLVRVLESWRKRQDSADGVFNFISSWFVYGQQPFPHSVREDAECRPRGFYSITKRCAEQLLVSYCETYDLRYRILRLGNVVGPGDGKVSAKKNALQYLINQLAEDKPIEIYGNGGNFRDYIHVEDCARALDLAVTKGELDSIYNIGNGHVIADSLRDILLYAAQQLHSSSEITYIPAKKFHTTVQVETFSMDVRKIRALGYVPEYTGTKLYDTLLPARSDACAS